MKKTATVCFTTLLFSTSLLPVAAFANERTESVEQTLPTEEVKQQETMDSTTSESSEQPVDEPKKETEESGSVKIPEVQTPIVTPSNETPQQPIINQPTESSDVVVAQTEPQIEEPSNAATIEVDPSAIHFDKNVTTEEFIAKVGDYARTVGQEKDLYASVMIAQAILESGSGSSQLAQEPNNNLFGIKGDYKGQFIVYGTWEDDGQGNSYNTDASFRVYPSMKESFEDYSVLLIDGLIDNPMIYQGAWKSNTTTYQDATQALTGTYATDTQYNQKLNELIETYNLTQYDQEKESVIVGGDFEPYNNVNYDTGNSYAFGNCTQYVYNRITQLGGYIDLDMGNGQDWSVTGRARGYEVSNTPKIGTAVSFNAGVLGADSTYGHVAFVEKINEDGSILISEMNAQGLNVVSTRTIQAEYVGMLSYVTPK